MRAAMHFRRIQYGPYTLTLMEGNEPGYCEGGALLVSIEGPGLPIRRLTEKGMEFLSLDDVNSLSLPAEDGLLLFGTFKGDRPALGRVDPQEPG